MYYIVIQIYSQEFIIFVKRHANKLLVHVATCMMYLGIHIHKAVTVLTCIKHAVAKSTEARQVESLNAVHFINLWQKQF